MSLLFVAALPMQAALPAAELVAGSVSTLVRPLLGLSALVTFVMLFKPLLRGLLRAAILMVNPRPSLEERIARNRVQNTRVLLRLARDFDHLQPNQAAEFRAMASKD